VLQVVLQLANTLVVDQCSVEFLTPQVVGAMMTVSLQLSESAHHHASVATTAFATVRQLMALIMDDAGENLLQLKSASVAPATAADFVPPPGGSPVIKGLAAPPSGSQLPRCAELLVRDLCSFAKGLSGEWLKGIARHAVSIFSPFLTALSRALNAGASVAPNMAMDLILEVVSGWKRVFLEVPAFKEILSTSVSPCVKPFLRSLRDDYFSALKTNGAAAANAQVSQVVRIARTLLTSFLTVRGFLLEAEMLVNLMMHSILPEKMGNGSAVIGGDGSGRQIIGIEEGSKLRFDDGTFQIVGIGTGVAALAGGLKWLASQAGGGIKGVASGGPGSAGASVSGGGTSRGSGAAGIGFLALCIAPPPTSAVTQLGLTSGVSAGTANSYSALGSNAVSGAGADVVFVPSFPIAICLETILALFLTDRATDVMVMGLGGSDAIKTIYAAVLTAVGALLNEAFAIESNVR
jgi:hypothetical protein